MCLGSAVKTAFQASAIEDCNDLEVQSPNRIGSLEAQLEWQAHAVSPVRGEISTKSLFPEVSA